MNVLSLNTNRTFAIMMLFIVILALLSPIAAFAEGNDPDPNTDTGSFWSDFDVTVSGTDLSVGEKEGDLASGLGGILEKYKGVIVGIGGLAAVTMVGIFIFHLVALGRSAGNPQARTQALTGLMWTGVATAGLGAVALITSLFYGSIK